tara:strand:- start:39781 stop:40095 length:315 start_codon:yes stop_codon:yes gene_type:complete
VIDLAQLKNGIQIKDKVATLAIYVQPNARKTEFEKIHDDQIKIKVNAPPEDGKANDEIVRYIAKFFSLRKNQVEIISGHLARKKRIALSFDKVLSLADLQKFFS